MGFFDWVNDWNGDGVKDSSDAYMEYQIYQQVTNAVNGTQQDEEDEE